MTDDLAVAGVGDIVVCELDNGEEMRFLISDKGPVCLTGEARGKVQEGEIKGKTEEEILNQWTHDYVEDVKIEYQDGKCGEWLLEKEMEGDEG